jgi:hypothetical protein
MNPKPISSVIKGKRLMGDYIGSRQYFDGQLNI